MALFRRLAAERVFNDHVVFVVADRIAVAQLHPVLIGSCCRAGEEGTHPCGVSSADSVQHLVFFPVAAGYLCSPGGLKFLFKCRGGYSRSLFLHRVMRHVHADRAALCFREQTVPQSREQRLQISGLGQNRKAAVVVFDLPAPVGGQPVFPADIQNRLAGDAAVGVGADQEAGKRFDAGGRPCTGRAAGRGAPQPQHRVKYIVRILQDQSVSGPAHGACRQDCRGLLPGKPQDLTSKSQVAVPDPVEYGEIPGGNSKPGKLPVRHGKERLAGFARRRVCESRGIRRPAGGPAVRRTGDHRVRHRKCPPLSTWRIAPKAFPRGSRARS